MLKICLVFSESEPQYAYKLYAYKKKHVFVDVNRIHISSFAQHLERLGQSTCHILVKDLIFVHRGLLFCGMRILNYFRS